MARRKKPAINGFMLRKRGIHKRFSQATVKVKTRVNYVQMPERYSAKKPPKPDRRGTVFHEVPPIRRISVEVAKTENRREELRIKELWTGYRHHGLIDFNYKELQSRGRPPYYWVRIYFKGDEALFIEYDRGVHRRSPMFKGLHIAMAIYAKGGVFYTEE